MCVFLASPLLSSRRNGLSCAILGEQERAEVSERKKAVAVSFSHTHVHLYWAVSAEQNADSLLDFHFYII